MKKFLSIPVGIAAVLVAMEFSPSTTPPIIASVTKSACVIKGNISYNTGRKLYHLPGMEDYENTVIDFSRGERWFCTEAEAIEAGWQKAPK